MSHVNAGGSTRQHHQRHGKRLGLKKSGGQAVAPGQIIVRQRGQTYRPGMGVGMGRDFSIFALRSGVVTFAKRLGKTFIHISE